MMDFLQPIGLTGTEAAGFGAAFAVLLLLAGANDLRTGRLPDALNGLIFLTGLLFAAWTAGVASAASGVAAAVLGGSMLSVVAGAYRSARGRDGLGGGDTKLVMACGPWVGLAGVAPMTLLAASSGLLVAGGMALAGRSLTPATSLPFGPFLAVAAYLVWLARVTGWSP